MATEAAILEKAIMVLAQQVHARDMEIARLRDEIARRVQEQIRIADVSRN